MVTGRMWLVVKPTVFIPIMFVAIIVAARSIHPALLLTTDCFVAFLKGRPRAAVGSVMPNDIAAPNAALASVQIAPVTLVR